MADTNAHHDDEAPESTPGYQAPKKVGLETLVNQDAEDESLRRYKEQLLGAAAKGEIEKTDDPRKVVIQEFRIIFEEKPGNDTVYDLTGGASALERLKTVPFVLKEKCNYKIQVTFKVQHDIVSGLKYQNFVYRMGMRVDKDELMLGSYGPQKDPHVVQFPRREWQQAPSGMLARGSYSAKSRFVDDDGQVHMEYEFCFELKKDF